MCCRQGHLSTGCKTSWGEHLKNQRHCLYPSHPFVIDDATRELRCGSDSENPTTQTASRVEADCRASLLRRRVVGSRHAFMPFCWDAAPLSRVQCLECNGWIVTPMASIFWDDGYCKSGFDHDYDGFRNSISVSVWRPHGGMVLACSGCRQCLIELVGSRAFSISYYLVTSE